MTPITTARLVVSLAAVILIGWGMRTDQSSLRLAGMGLLIAALLMRFLGSRFNRRD